MDALTRCFSAWRVIRAGNREVVEGLVAPEHQGPSPELTSAISAWPYAHYWAGPPGKELVLIRPLGPARTEAWLLHGVLFLVTVLCALGAGAALAGDFDPPVGAGVLGALAAGARFFVVFLQSPLETILSGWSFAVPLLAILLVHELGHYFAAHRYAIDASPPYFLPIPPTLSPIGSLGAFLRLRSPVVDRRQLLDVGAAGPLAGFVVVLVVLTWGYATSDPLPAGTDLPSSFIEFAGNRFGLGESLLTWACRGAVPSGGRVGPPQSHRLCGVGRRPDHRAQPAAPVPARWRARGLRPSRPLAEAARTGRAARAGVAVAVLVRLVVLGADHAHGGRVALDPSVGDLSRSAGTPRAAGPGVALRAGVRGDVHAGALRGSRAKACLGPTGSDPRTPSIESSANLILRTPARGRFPQQPGSHRDV